MLAGNDASYPGSYESIQTVTVGAGGASSVSFTSIPSTYTHLQVRAVLMTSVADRSIRVNFNSDTASNYTFHNIQSDGASVSVNNYTAQAYGIIGSAPNSTTFPGIFVADILDYADGNKFKTSRSLIGADNNGGTGYAQLWSSLWRSTSTISTITCVPSSGNFNQYTTFALYGIK
jgi:hypothetical protein